MTENCAALPDTLLESELFGHAKGAFTGAYRAKKGLLEQADGGTLFLDEIGDMSPGMQKKLLRVLQEGEFRVLGSDRTVKVDVRILTASHRNLEEMVREGTFREDLFYRVAVLSVDLPALGIVVMTSRCWPSTCCCGRRGGSRRSRPCPMMWSPCSAATTGRATCGSSRTRCATSGGGGRADPGGAPLAVGGAGLWSQRQPGGGGCGPRGR